MKPLKVRQAEREERNKDNEQATLQYGRFADGKGNDNANGGGQGGSTDDNETDIDKMTVAQLDEYIKRRGGTSSGNQAAKRELAHTLPKEENQAPASGW